MENDILKQRERVRNNVLESFLDSNEIEKGGGNKHYFSTKERENLAKKVKHYQMVLFLFVIRKI